MTQMAFNAALSNPDLLKSATASAPSTKPSWFESVAAKIESYLDWSAGEMAYGEEEEDGA